MKYTTVTYRSRVFFSCFRNAIKLMFEEKKKTKQIVKLNCDCVIKKNEALDAFNRTNFSVGKMRELLN